MPTPTEFTSTLVLGGRVDSSLDKMSKDVQAKLGGLEKVTANWEQGIARIGKELVGLGTAFVGLRTGLSFFEDTVKQAQSLADITNDLHGNLLKMFATRDNATQLTIQFQKFNEELRKTSVYSQDISEAFESAMSARGFRPEVTRRLVAPMQQLAASQGVKLSPEQSRAMADAWANWVKEGNISGLQGLGIPLSFAQRQQMQTMQRGNPLRPGEIIDARERYAEQLLADPRMRQQLAGGFAAFRANPNVAGYELGQQVKGVQEDIGQELLKVLNPMAEGLSGWIQKNPSMSAGVAAGLAVGGPVLAGAIAKALAGVVFGGVEKKITSALGGKVTGEMNVKAGVVNVFGPGGGALAKGAGEAAGVSEAVGGGSALAGAGVIAGLTLPAILVTELHKKYGWFGTTTSEPAAGGLGISGGAARAETNPLFQSTKQKVLEARKIHSAFEKIINIPVPAHQAGGIVTKPHIGMIGEAGPEAIIPLGGSAFADPEKRLKAVDDNTKKLKENKDVTTELTKVMQQLVDYERGMGGPAGVGGGGLGGGGATFLNPATGSYESLKGGVGGGGGGGAAAIEAAAASAGGKGGGGLSVYRKLLAAYQKSGLVGKIPADGAKFGFKTGSAAEWARFGTAVAAQESDFNPRSTNLSDPGGSFGVFQYGKGQVPGGDPHNVDASVTQFVTDSKDAMEHGGITSHKGMIWRRFGSIRRPNEALSRMGEAQGIANAVDKSSAIAQKARGGFIGSKMLSWLGEKGPEFVIPATRSSRSVGLLNQAAGAIGMGVHEGGGGHMIHFNPNITINAAGHNAQELHQVIIRAIQEQPQHLRRVLQGLYRTEQRTGLA
jgi:hypothetical protein